MNENSGKKALVNAALFDFDTYRENGYVLFDDKIRAVGPMAEFGAVKPFVDPGKIFDCAGGVVLPGLVCGHAHIYSTFARGWVAPFHPASFRELLEQLWWKLDAGLDRAAVYQSGLVSGVEYAKNGVTTVIDHHASGKEIRGTLGELKRAVCDESGLRGVFCFETSDRFPVEDCIAENVEFAQQHDSMHAGLFGLHASMTLSDRTLRRVYAADGNLPVHIHVAESAEDEAACERAHGSRIPNRLDAFGLLRPGSLLSHCVHVDPRDYDLLRRRGVRIAVNPTSNMNNGVGLPDLPAFLANGIPCLLGNDGLGYGMAKELQNAVFTMHHRAQSPVAFGFDGLRAMLRESYDYAGSLLGCSLGRFAPGYEADMLFLPYDPPTPLGEKNVWGHFFYGMLERFTPREVWCAGKTLLLGGKTAADEAGIFREARSVAGRLWKQIS